MGSLRTWLLVGLALGLAAQPGVGSSITFSLANPGSGVVPMGTDVVLEVRATFDTRLSAAAFSLSALGTAGASMISRSLNPTGPNGLTYVSLTSQDPFQSNLPHDLVASPMVEAAYDNDFGPAPGSVADGLAAGSNVLIETITVRPAQMGTVTISLGSPSAAHTTGSPDGSQFDLATVANASVVLTVTGPGDSDQDGDVDLADAANFVGCMTGPNAGPVGPACTTFDFNSDTDVDLDDFSDFQVVFTSSP